jgi:hypothetical protein
MLASMLGGMFGGGGGGGGGGMSTSTTDTTSTAQTTEANIGFESGSMNVGSGSQAVGGTNDMGPILVGIVAVVVIMLLGRKR